MEKMKQHIRKRIQALEKHPGEYIASRQIEFKEATSNSDLITAHLKKRISKELNSKDISSGYAALLSARGRAPFMVYWNQYQILTGAGNSLELFSMAMNNIWWAFKCRPSTYGDYESLIQLMLPWFDLVGYQERKNFMGRYFSGQTSIEGYEKYIRDSMIGRFVSHIWLWENGEKMACSEYMAFNVKTTFYKDLIEEIENSDTENMRNNITLALDYHIISASTENGEFRTAYPFYLMPVEIIYYINARARKGLGTRVPEHPIFSSLLSSIKDKIDISSQTIKDSILFKALSHATKTGWISENDITLYEK